MSDGQTIVGSIRDHRSRSSMALVEAPTPVALGASLVEELPERRRHGLLQ